MTDRKREPIGVSRRIQDRGRLSLPKALRDELNFEEGTVVEFLYDRTNEEVIMKRTDKITMCHFCGQRTHNIFKGRPLCDDCKTDIKEG